jgi:hypothetical protein
MIQRSKQAWFEVWGNEVAQNRFLKYLVVVLSAVSAVFAIALTLVALRPPQVFAVSSVESGALRAAPVPKEYLEAEAKRVVTEYLQKRHSWEPRSVQASIGKASRFVDESFRKAFLQANDSQIRIAIEKKITQKFYVSAISVDLEKGTSSVSGDRLLTVDGFRAVNTLSFELKLRFGERTETNPEGVYITAEQLVETSREVK